MKALTLVLALAFSFGAALATRNPQPQPGPVAQNQSQTKGNSGDGTTASYRPGIGTVIVAELTNSIGTKRMKVGDHIECKVAQMPELSDA